MLQNKIKYGLVVKRFKKIKKARLDLRYDY